MDEHEPKRDYLTINGRLLDTINIFTEAHFNSLAPGMARDITFGDLAREDEDPDIETNPDLEADCINSVMVMKELEIAYQRAFLQQMHGEEVDIDAMMHNYIPERLTATRYRAMTYKDSIFDTVFSLEMISLYNQEKTEYARRYQLRQTSEQVTETTTLVYFDGHPASAKRRVGAAQDMLRYGAETDEAQQALSFARSIGISDRPSSLELRQIIKVIKEFPNSPNIDI